MLSVESCVPAPGAKCWERLYRVLAGFRPSRPERVRVYEVGSSVKVETSREARRGNSELRFTAGRFHLRGYQVCSDVSSVRSRLLVRSASFYEADPLEGDLGPSLAGKQSQIDCVYKKSSWLHFGLYLIFFPLGFRF